MKARAWLLPVFAVVSAAAAEPVRLWETNLVIPTYLAAPPSPVPRFYEGRTYQGAKATFYPYPVQDVLTDVKSNVTYRALFLENQYLQICVLPELGGRIFSAVDKSNGYDFFYRQHVIKPALIGMLGAWISGGVEWNVPHHHRATSFSPVDYTTTTNADGSATIWVGEIELRSRMKWLVGMTLYPDRSYLELTCKMFNRTPFAWPMLFWINAAVHANENYQVIFPPSTEWAAQHAKPEFASWPIAHQVYGGTDYTRGVDISWWKNHPNPVSFFAWNYQDDWFGGYDHGREAGVVEVSDHHVAPGKKFFEWGNGPEGESWSKILTDTDGPYLELMAGAWSDNQPDYSWIQPGETREWKHWWYPIRNLGGVKAATRDAAVNLEVTNHVAKIAVNATREFKGSKVRLVLVESTRSSSMTTSSPSPQPSPLGRDSTAREKPRIVPLNLVVASHWKSTILPGGSWVGSDASRAGAKSSALEPSISGGDASLSLGERFHGPRKAANRAPEPSRRKSLEINHTAGRFMGRAGVRGNGATEVRTLFEQTADLNPPKPFSTTVTTENEVAAQQLRVSVTDSDGKELVAYQPAAPKDTPMPKPVERPKPPKDYASTDELYFTGQRIEQLYSPSFEARPYYEEMIRRDPGDYRANTAMGILLCKQWRWEEATRYLSNAIARATANYIRPQDGEAFYYLGVALRAQDRLGDAADAFAKAAWSDAWRTRAELSVAEIHCARREFRSARAALAPVLGSTPFDPRTWCLRATISRHLDDRHDAMVWANLAHQSDPLDTLAWNELALERRMGETDEPYNRTLAELAQVMRGDAQSHLELATDYESLGLWDEAIEVLQRVVNPQYRDAQPLPLYHLAFCVEEAGRVQEAAALFKQASQQRPDLCFASRFEEERILRRAQEVNRNDANAPYLLGCLLYDNQPENAIKAWEESRQRDDRFALTHRNLGLAYAQYEHDVPKAIASLEKAVEFDPNEPRFFYELDREYEANGTAVAKRLDLLLQHQEVVARRDDALTREIELLIVAGLGDPAKLDRAVELLTTHHFRNWEGSGQIHNVYVDALLARGQVRLKAGQAADALKDFQAALEFPANLEVGRARRSPRSAQIQYLIGLANAALGEAAKAKAAFETASAGRGGGPSDGQYFHALALQKLGRDADATAAFEGLVKAGEAQLTRGEQADYFAKFGEKQSERVRQANAHYLIGLGKLGLRDEALAEAEFRQALELHPAHLGAAQQTARP